MMLSKSKIGTFQTCPYLFKLKYIDKKLEDAGKNPVMERGIRLHKVLDDFYNKGNNYKEFIENIKQHDDYDEFSEQVKNFVSWNYDNSLRIPLHREVWVESTKLGVRGIIDRVDEEEDGKIIVWDYKSGRVNPLSKYRFELALYALLYQTTTGKIPDKWGVYFVDHNIEKVENVDQKYVENAVVKVASARKEIVERVTNGEFEKKCSGFCNFCEAKKEGFCEGKK